MSCPVVAEGESSINIQSQHNRVCEVPETVELRLSCVSHVRRWGWVRGGSQSSWKEPNRSSLS